MQKTLFQLNYTTMFFDDLGEISFSIDSTKTFPTRIGAINHLRAMKQFTHIDNTGVFVNTFRKFKVSASGKKMFVKLPIPEMI